MSEIRKIVAWILGLFGWRNRPFARCQAWCSENPTLAGWRPGSVDKCRQPAPRYYVYNETDELPLCRQHAEKWLASGVDVLDRSGVLVRRFETLGRGQ